MKLKLYHGTSSVHLDNILRSGIRPRYNKKSEWKCASKDNMIYLTNAYPIHFAQHSALNNGGEPIIFEVEVDSDRLYPDEDFLEQASFYILQGLSMKQRTKYFRNNLENYKNHYNDSIKFLGNCCHKGYINKKQIIRYVIPDKKSIAFSDPSITIENYRTMGDYYLHLIQIMFDKKEPQSYWEYKGYDKINFKDLENKQLIK